MNKERKARFDEVVGLLESAKDELYDIQGEEQDAYDSLSDNFQMSSRGDAMLEWIDFMDGAISDIDNVITKISKKIN